MILVGFSITLLYVLVIAGFVWGFNKVDTFKMEDLPAKTKFSIIIPFRNEAENLPDLLKSLKALNYPKHYFEIILVDDDSEDHSVDCIKNTLKFIANVNEQSNISIIVNERKTNAPKKDAITTGIKKAKYDWIVTTDADCILPKFWLDAFDEFIQKNNTLFIAAPVIYNTTHSFLSRFQLLDILSLQGATIGGFGLNKPFMCNGANLCYKKSLFTTLHGFEGNLNIASGDDIFLLEKTLKKFPKQVHYLKSEQAIVQTHAQSSWKNLTFQRIRWAAKTSAYKNWFSKLTGLVVLLMNAKIIIALTSAIMGIISYKTFIYIAFIKLNIDFLLLYKSASFFNKITVLKSYLLAFFIYPFFSVFVACNSIFSGYKWKGRRFKK